MKTVTVILGGEHSTPTPARTLPALDSAGNWPCSLALSTWEGEEHAELLTVSTCSWDSYCHSSHGSLTEGLNFSLLFVALNLYQETYLFPFKIFSGT